MHRHMNAVSLWLNLKWKQNHYINNCLLCLVFLYSCNQTYFPAFIAFSFSSVNFFSLASNWFRISFTSCSRRPIRSLLSCHLLFRDLKYSCIKSGWSHYAWTKSLKLASEQKSIFPFSHLCLLFSPMKLFESLVIKLSKENLQVYQKFGNKVNYSSWDI